MKIALAIILCSFGFALFFLIDGYGIASHSLMDTLWPYIDILGIVLIIAWLYVMGWIFKKLIERVRVD